MQKKTTRCLVTGGAGFIGSHLASALLNRGDEVRVLDDLSTGRRDNLPQSVNRFEFLEGSICDGQLLATAMDGVDYVFHLAGLSAVPESVENPRKCIELNDIGVFNIYQAAAEAAVKRVVFSSSSAIYGAADIPHHEELCPFPDTPYAMHKLLGEHYGLFYAQYKQLESVYLRYFNVYGPRQLPDSPYSGVISLFMAGLKEGRGGLIFDDGLQTRDFIHVDDVVRANLAGAHSVGVSGMAFNIGSGQATTILDLYLQLVTLTGREDLPPTFAPPRPGDIRHSCGPVKKATNFLDFSAQVSLDEGLAATWEWFSNSQGLLP